MNCLALFKTYILQFQSLLMILSLFCITVESHNMKGNPNGYIYSGTTLVGIFSLSDSCRSGAMEAIEEMKTLGIKSVMLTGDSHTAAMLAQDQVGNTLPINEI